MSDRLQSERVAWGRRVEELSDLPGQLCADLNVQRDKMGGYLGKRIAQ